MSRRVALVTGAGRGIGRAIAERLAADHFQVAVVTRSAASGEGTVDAIARAGGKARLFSADAGDRATLIAVVAAIEADWGRLDVVVQNAALMRPIPLDGGDDTALDAVIDLNLKSSFWLLRAALPLLKASASARYLIVSSITGNRIANSGYAAYGATKAGINGFIRQAAVELGPLGVRVNGVEPGVTLTDSVSGSLGESAAKIADALPLRRITTPTDVAAVIGFLASEHASQITGQTIVVDGGQSLGGTDLGIGKR